MARFQVGDIVKVIGEDYRDPWTGEIDNSLYIIIKKVLMKDFYFNRGARKAVSMLCAICQPAFYPQPPIRQGFPNNSGPIIPIKDLELVQRP